MAILDNYMFRLLLAIIRLSSREIKVLLYTLCPHVVQRSLQRALLRMYTSLHHVRAQCTVYSRALSSLEDNLKMASKGGNMQLSSIAIKYTLIDIVVFDYIPFPIFTHTTGMTHFLEQLC